MDNKDNNVPIHKMNTDTILVELIKNQKKNIPVDKKLLHNDLKPIPYLVMNVHYGLVILLLLKMTIKTPMSIFIIVVKNMLCIDYCIKILLVNC